ncbi:arsenic resistance protein [Gordonia pseudamarae]|jgi:ACR3 family arsenite transporter|uniref:Arsenic resistance protein n=1 Tax=Gordonia pseudamarae TaxID=2831662 RepID=A0ABX6IHY0_9ACTN|nr:MULTISPECIES: bile acid:sodium symporter [Gordonia]MBD0023706.1 arsenic resistance protein [Gordonia sp. (in: high G+C Gram-positive bacteria)]QHN26589.1 arsenic resistance protein [Gordonia pseudamarae]QHN35482.1 arsenic resistance protein [Gordonia pseudamarae]
MAARIVDTMDRHQVPIYIVAIIVGALAGLAVPDTTGSLSSVMNPALAALLFVTFLQVPIASLAEAARDTRFLSALLVVNFVVVPLLVAALLPLLPGDDAVRIGVLLVLLCPCVDYVVVFTGLAGGDAARLVAATPLLLLAQMALLPLYLRLFMDDAIGDILDVRPFVEAFVVIIVVPLLLAWLTQWLVRADLRRPTPRGLRRLPDTAAATMVPLMVLVLVVVTASQVPHIDGRAGDVARVVPVYIAFLAAMIVLGAALARLWRLPPPRARAVAFSAATRNSLVVMPLALALPDGMEIAAAVIVAQTLVEVVGMAICVRAVPALVKD